MSGIETQATITAWQRATFGPGGTLFRQATRANIEMAELLVKISADGSHAEIRREIADVAIVLYGVATLGGFDLAAQHQSVPTWCNEEDDVVLFAHSRMAEMLWRIHNRKPFIIVTRQVFASLRRACVLFGGDLDAEVDAKMAINRARCWMMTDLGHGRHVDDNAGMGAGA
jgi:hypothetical protein